MSGTVANSNFREHFCVVLRLFIQPSSHPTSSASLLTTPTHCCQKTLLSEGYFPTQTHPFFQPPSKETKITFCLQLDVIWSCQIRTMKNTAQHCALGTQLHVKGQGYINSSDAAWEKSDTRNVHQEQVRQKKCTLQAVAVIACLNCYIRCLRYIICFHFIDQTLTPHGPWMTG